MLRLRSVVFVLLFGDVCLAISTHGADTIQRPVPDDGGPTKIYVAMGLLDVDEIDGAAQSFTANLYISIRWHDPRLVHDGPGKLVRPLYEVWNPRLIFVNQQKIWNTMPEAVRIAPDGEVVYRQRIWGPFSQPLEVQNFPFDIQGFEIRLATAGYTPDEVMFLTDPDTRSGLAEHFSLPDWEVLHWELDSEPYRPTGSREGAASFALVFHAKRYASHYVAKVILPLILIVAMSWIVFWINPEQASTQIGVATTSMLTLIAYRFMVGGSLPPVPYLTRMDYFILGSTLLVFIALVQAVITSIMASRGHEQRARKFDAWCRILFPAAFAAVALVSLVIL